MDKKTIDEHLKKWAKELDEQIMSELRESQRYDQESILIASKRLGAALRANEPIVPEPPHPAAYGLTWEDFMEVRRKVKDGLGDDLMGAKRTGGEGLVKGTIWDDENPKTETSFTPRSPSTLFGMPVIESDDLPEGTLGMMLRRPQRRIPLRIEKVELHNDGPDKNGDMVQFRMMARWKWNDGALRKAITEMQAISFGYNMHDGLDLDISFVPGWRPRWNRTHVAIGIGVLLAVLEVLLLLAH